MRRNPRLRVGVYNQHFVDRLPMEEDPVTYLRRLFNEETYQSCRNILGKKMIYLGLIRFRCYSRINMMIINLS